MRVKPTEVASGMHTPSGENMWAYPADDQELEEADDLTKEALGLLSMPGQVSSDYQFEQSPHIKENENVGIIDVNFVDSVPPVNQIQNESSDSIQDLINEKASYRLATAHKVVSTLIKSNNIDESWEKYLISKINIKNISLGDVNLNWLIKQIQIAALWTHFSKIGNLESTYQSFINTGKSLNLWNESTAPELVWDQLIKLNKQYSDGKNLIKLNPGGLNLNSIGNDFKGEYNFPGNTPINNKREQVNPLIDNKSGNIMKDTLSNLINILEAKGYTNYSNLIKNSNLVNDLTDSSLEDYNLEADKSVKGTPIDTSKESPTEQAKKYLTYGPDIPYKTYGPEAPYPGSTSKQPYSRTPYEPNSKGEYHKQPPYPGGTSSVPKNENPVKMKEPQQATAFDWAKYAAQGPAYKAFADAWQASPPVGYTADFKSFAQWYNLKSKELGQPFGPEEALQMISGTSTIPANEVGPKLDETAPPPTTPTEEKVQSVDVKTYLEDAIRLLMSKELKMNTFFRPERKQANRWVRKYFDGNISTAAESIMDNLSEEQWRKLIADDMKAAAGPKQKTKDGTTTVRSGNFFEQVYQGLQFDKKTIKHQNREDRRAARRAYLNNTLVKKA